MASPLPILPENLLDLLAVTSAPLASTAVRFTRAIGDPADHFNRALEVLGSLEGNEASQQGTDASAAPGFDLNAEFLLYWFYREFGVRKNPFLTHWIGTCRLKPTLSASPSSNKGKGKGNVALSEEEELRAKARLRLIYHILSGDGEKVGAYTPEEIYSNLDAFLPHIQVDISLFDMQTDSAFPEDDPFGNDALAASSLGVRELLSEAFERPLSSYERERVEKTLERSPPADIVSAELLGGLLSNNPSVAAALAKAVLSNRGDDESEGGANHKEAREYLLSTAMPRLEVDLPSLEFLTRLVETDLLTTEEYSHLLHLYLAQAIRRTEALIGTGNDESDPKRADVVINFNPLGSSNPAGGGKLAQARNIRLLCLFIENMLRKGHINVEEFFYEIQDIGVRYIWVKEARSLWMRINGGGVTGMGGTGMGG